MLNKQKIPINFSQGIDTFTDDFQMQGKFEKIENMYQDKAGAIKKRAGYTAANLPFDNASEVLSSGDDYVVLADNNVYVVTEDEESSSVSKGIYHNINIEKEVLYSTYSSMENIEYSRKGDIAVICFNTNDDLSVIVVYNLITKNVIKKYESSDPAKFKICFTDTFFFVFAVNVETGSTLKVTRIPHNNLNIAYTTTLANDAGSPYYSLCVLNNRVFCAYNKAATVRLIVVTEQGLVGDSSNGNPNGIDIIGAQQDKLQLSIWEEEESFLVSYATSTFVSSTIYTRDLTTPTLYYNIILDLKDGGSFRIDGKYAICQGNNNQKILYKLNDFQNTSTEESVQSYPDLFYPVSNIILRNNIPTILCKYNSTYYYYDLLNRSVIAMFSTELAGSANKTLIMDDEYLVFTERASLYRDHLMISKLTWDTPSKAEVFNQIIYRTGGFLSKFDGENLTESGFLQKPEIHSSSAVDAGVVNGTVLYCVVFEYVDAKGNIERSQPSSYLSLTVTNKTVVINVNPVLFTNKRKYSIVLYRTLAGGSIFYQVDANLTSYDPAYIIPVNLYYSIIDNNSDVAISSNPILYTTGEIENIPVPACSSIAKSGNRMYISGAECGNKVFYSKFLNRGFDVSFSDSYYVLHSEPITSVAVLDDKVISFSKFNSYAFVEQDGSFSTPQNITNDKIGCVSPNSVVNTPEGLMFQSQKGIYTLNRQLEMMYIGKEITDYLMFVNNAFVQNNNNQIRFYQENDVLVYDFMFKSWTRFTYKQDIKGATISQDKEVLLTNNQLLKEDVVFTDAQVPYKCSVTTGWLSFNGIQGFQRVYKVLILGKFKGAHKLRIKFAYDYQEFNTETLEINTEIIYNQTAPIFGQGVFGGIENGVYQFEAHPSKQKCQAIKVTIEDDYQGTDTMELSGMAFIVGTKQEFKTTATRQMR